MGLKKNKKIIDVFFNLPDRSIQFPVLPKSGLHIGDFNAQGFGIEFIIDDIGFEPDLEFLSKNDSNIEVEKLSSSATQVEYFDHWNTKEKILNFLDPCAFYGSLKKTKIYDGNNGLKKTGASIYTDVLSKFINKNRVYIDIRNDLNYSYNYFKNYTENLNSQSPTPTSLLVNFNNTALNPSSSITNFTPIDYNSWSTNWPILILNNSNFTNISSADNELYLQLSFPKADNLNPIFVIKQGQTKTNSIQKSKNKNLKFISFPNASNFSEVINLLVPNLKLAGSNINLISSYIRAIYAKEAPQGIDPSLIRYDTVFNQYDDLDNIFTPFDMYLPEDTNNPSPPFTTMDSWVYKNEVYTDVMRTSSQLFIGNSGISRDTSGNITLFCFSTKKTERK